MIDIILVSLLLAVGGWLVWMQRSQVPVPAGLETDDVSTEAPNQGYFWRLARPAGLAPEQAWPFFIGSKIALAVLLPLFAVMVLGAGIFGVLVAAIVGFFAPDALIAYVRRQRQTAIRRALSFFLDLLVSLLQAGLSLDEAFKRAAREGLPKGHPLAEEAALVVEEMDMGRDRAAGFQALADRTGVRELRGLANALALGLGIGTSVETTLRAQADLARAKRREEGLARLQMASAEVLLPLMLCGFPVFLVIVFFPLGVLMMRNMDALGLALR